MSAQANGFLQRGSAWSPGIDQRAHADMREDALSRGLPSPPVKIKPDELELAFLLRPCFVCGVRGRCGHREPDVERSLIRIGCLGMSTTGGVFD